MENKTNSSRIHPLVATAAVAITLVSLVGVAAITGLLPNTKADPNAANGTVPPQASNLAASAPQVETPKAAPKVAAAEPVESTPHKTTHTAPAKHVARAPESDYTQRPVQQVAKAPSYCDNCGRIESIQAVAQPVQQGSGIGIAAGAVLGGVLGNQVGNGNGRTLATVAGALGGGYAGNEVEKRTRTKTTYQVRVRMEDGSVRTVPQSSQNNWQVGDKVKVVNGALVSEG